MRYLGYVYFFEAQTATTLSPIRLHPSEYKWVLLASVVLVFAYNERNEQKSEREKDVLQRRIENKERKLVTVAVIHNTTPRHTPSRPTPSNHSVSEM